MRVRGLQILRHRKDEAKAADQRVLYDPSLRPGDIVATSSGFVVFVGRDSEERRLGDFLPAPSGVSTADALRSIAALHKNSAACSITWG
jgi:hypothetical protein